MAFKQQFGILTVDTASVVDHFDRLQSAGSDLDQDLT